MHPCRIAENEMLLSECQQICLSYSFHLCGRFPDHAAADARLVALVRPSFQEAFLSGGLPFEPAVPMGQILQFVPHLIGLRLPILACLSLR